MTSTIHTMTFATFCWVPWEINRHSTFTNPVAWLKLPGDLILSIGLGVDFDEREVCSVGPLLLTRLETPEEREERKEAESEAAFMEQEANRYTEWSY